ncbi:MAG: PEP-CTERM sorting domain-containing protein [Thermoguttaceae bacterium]
MKWRNRLSFALGMVVAGIVVAGGGLKAYGQFAYAVIADPHATTTDHLSNLQSAVNYIISTKTARNTQLVFVAGDIAWGTGNLTAAKTVLDTLNTAGIPYVPLIGDNEVHSGYEAAFQTTFSSQYTYLASTLTNWQKAATPVSGRYLENFSFDYGNCHFACADFASRTSGDEGGDLNNITGGTWSWLKNDIQTCSKPKNENINIITHIPMFRTGVSTADQYLFDSTEMSTITTFLDSYKTNVAANYAGHIHQNFSWNVSKNWYSSTIYTSYVTDETWYDTRFPELNDTSDTVRFVTATTGATSMSYSQSVVAVDTELYAASLGSVSLTAIPEPGTLILLALGLLSFGSISACSKKRQRGHR